MHFLLLFPRRLWFPFFLATSLLSVVPHPAQPVLVAAVDTGLQRRRREFTRLATGNQDSCIGGHTGSNSTAARSFQVGCSAPLHPPSPTNNITAGHDKHPSGNWCRDRTSQPHLRLAQDAVFGLTSNTAPCLQQTPVPPQVRLSALTRAFSSSTPPPPPAAPTKNHTAPPPPPPPHPPPKHPHPPPQAGFPLGPKNLFFPPPPPPRAC